MRRTERNKNSPECPVNFEVEKNIEMILSTDKRTVDFHCEEQYGILGRNQLKCKSDGKWNDQPPICGTELNNLCYDH